MGRSWVRNHVPRLWALWAASRPSQLALIGLVYGLGVGITTVGPPFIVGDPTANSIATVFAPAFSSQGIVGLIAILSVAIPIHYANEYADTDTDALTERTPFSGGSGALVETGLPQSFLHSAMLVAIVLSLTVVLIAVINGPLSLTAASLLLLILIVGVAYSLPPVKLVRRGVGEPVNMALGGLLLPVYGVSVVAQPTGVALLAVFPFTLIVGCNLLAVHWPDRQADKAVGKRTLAVRWTPKRIRTVYALLALLAAIGSISLWGADIFPDLIALAHLATFPFVVWGWVTVTRQRNPLPSVAAMVVLAITATVAWWWTGLG